MDSSDDDVPIGARPVLQAATQMVDLDGESNASGSPMPEWLSQHTPTQKGAATPDSDDSDDVVDLSTPALGTKASSKNAAPAGGGKEGGLSRQPGNVRTARVLQGPLFDSGRIFDSVAALPFHAYQTALYPSFRGKM